MAEYGNFYRLESHPLRHQSFQITLTNCRLFVEVRPVATTIEIDGAHKSGLISVLIEPTAPPLRLILFLALHKN